MMTRPWRTLLPRVCASGAVYDCGVWIWGPEVPGACAGQGETLAAPTNYQPVDT